jgi:hypothetical protein
MSKDNLQMLARCRALALAAMIDAGGKPCWVAVAPASNDSADAPAPAPLSDRELRKLEGLPSKLLAAIERTLLRLPEAAPAPAPLPRSVGKLRRPQLNGVKATTGGLALRTCKGRGFERF